MTYNFDEIIPRTDSNAEKYDARAKVFGDANVIPLWIADMDFKVAQPILDALIKRAEQGIFGYTSRPDSYFQAICEWQQKRHGWTIDPELISWSLGVVPALSAIVRIFANEGEKVLVQTPVISDIFEVIRGANREILQCAMIEKNGKWEVDYSELEAKLSDEKVKLFLLCSPQNPLGIVWSREELTRMAELCIKHGVLLVCDEIHADLVFWGKQHIPAASLSPQIAEHVITCISGVKTFNIAGIQASATVFPNVEMKHAFDAFWAGLNIARSNSFSVVAMEAAFREGEEWLDQLLPYLEGNLRFIKEYFDANIPQIKPTLPDATYLVWLDCRGLGLSHEALNRFMVEKAGLGMSDGAGFGENLAGFMRLNAACPREVLRKALSQLKSAVDQL